MTYIIYPFILICFIVYIHSQLSQIQVDPNTQQFVDEYGRVRIFHGVNVVYKIPPYLPNLTHFDPQNSLTDDDLDHLNQWGFNVIRFYTSWMGVNPRSENDIDEEYLLQLIKAIEMMESRGIYALLDCHQDIFSRYFCGEGVPNWIAEKLGDTMIKTFPYPIALNITREPDTGYPILDECLKHPFSEYYFTEAVMNGFNML
jgi:endoglycosylceramidase